MIVACIVVSFVVATVTATFVCFVALRSAGATSEYERAWLGLVSENRSVRVRRNPS